MKKRFCKHGRSWLGALCLISVCGATYSCTDEYELDDKSPSWLNASIYDYLQTNGNYKNFVKLIDDMEYAEVLDKTGSKTLFVADDDAFAEFFKSNPWGVASYNELTKSQNRLLMNSAMINNAYLLEMMSSTADNSDEGTDPQKGKCLRRETASSVTDSIPFFTPESLPKSYNLVDKDYWARFRKEGKGGIRMALDATNPMMTHFLEGQLASNRITNDDFAKLMGVERHPNDAYVFDSKVIESDIRCLNGYVNRLDKVLVTPQNLAEVLRTNGKTNVFSHMLDRFSAPFYNETLTARYKLIYGNEAADSVFEKRYFSLRSQGNTALNNDKGTDPIGNPVGNEVKYNLVYDPGWNFYCDEVPAGGTEKKTKEEDMAVIFAPTDEAMFDYFYKVEDGLDVGGGKFLVDAYAPGYPRPANAQDYETFYQAIDQIPLAVIQALINNLMQPSFCSAVPSKFITNVKNDAQDPMFESEEEGVGMIEGIEMANNGVVYLMNEVITPAQYASVSAPAYTATDMRIFNWAIERGRNNPLSEKLGNVVTNYYAYLLAMSSRFSFFVPKDDNFWYVDPVSFKDPKTTNGSTEIEGNIINYKWNADKSTPECAVYAYIYDVATGEGYVGAKKSTSTLTATEWGDRLRDMLQTHTIVHEDTASVTGIDETVTGIECDKHYFLTKNYAPIYVKNPYKGSTMDRRIGLEIQGGWELQHDSVRTVIRFDDKSENGNGMAYQIDRPMMTTIESVYSTFYSTPEFSEFFALCQTDGEVLEEIGIVKNTDKQRYDIFVDDGGLPCFDKTTGSRVETATNVRFFNNYNYTVYVPTNEAVRDAIDRGLPTWQSIAEFLELDKPEEERTELTPEEESARNVKALAMVTTLVNFVKYHFQDRSVFVDNPAVRPTTFETATLNSESGVYCKVDVESENGNGTLSVIDATGVKRNVTENVNYLTRDFTISNKVIAASSFAVIHGIDGVLNYKLYGGSAENPRYDVEWATESAAKKYLAKYRIIK